MTNMSYYMEPNISEDGSDNNDGCFFNKLLIVTYCPPS